MSGDEYLNEILKKYAVNEAGARAAGNAIYPVIEKWGREHLLRSDFSGSLAKGTGISIGTDADIFLSLTSGTPGTLSDMYNTLFNAVQAAGYPVRKQNVSVGTTVNGYTIDLVPGKRQSQHGNDHSLYSSKKDSWIQTNVVNHIAHIIDRERIDEIKILKIWRQLHQLTFPSFYLELAVIDALAHARRGNLAANVLTSLDHFRDKIEVVKYIDPANSNNTVSDLCNQFEKRAIAAKARETRGRSQWEQIVW